MAIYQDHQQKVYDELQTIFPTNDPPQITRENIENMLYTEWCIKETMRLYPIVALISRQNDRSLQLLGKCEIPAGTSIAINIHRIHRDPKYWGADANVFKPNRFERENFEKLHPYCYLPFSGGPRNCLGK